MIPGNGDGADGAREQLVQTTKRAAALQVALVALAGLAVIVASSTAVVVGLGNRSRTAANQKEIAVRQAETEKATAAAVQTILDFVNNAMAPHRLRNEAENRCGIETTYQMLTGPRLRDLDFYTGLYDACVLRRSGNTAPPPLPPNPLSTTTTR